MGKREGVTGLVIPDGMTGDMPMDHGLKNRGNAEVQCARRMSPSLVKKRRELRLPYPVDLRQRRLALGILPGGNVPCRERSDASRHQTSALEKNVIY